MVLPGYSYSGFAVAAKYTTAAAGWQSGRHYHPGATQLASVINSVASWAVTASANSSSVNLLSTGTRRIGPPTMWSSAGAMTAL